MSMSEQIYTKGFFNDVHILENLFIIVGVKIENNIGFTTEFIGTTKISTHTNSCFDS